MCLPYRAWPSRERWPQLAIMRWPSLLALGLAGLAVLLEAGHGHGFAMTDNALLLSQALHLLASGAWLGALMPLLIVVRTPLSPRPRLPRAASQRSGRSPVTVLAGTALYQGLELSGGLSGLTGTAYGGVLLTKAALFALLVALSGGQSLPPHPCARWTLTARRRGGRLLSSIAAETVIGLLVVLAASAAVEPRARHAYDGELAAACPPRVSSLREAALPADASPVKAAARRSET